MNSMSLSKDDIETILINLNASKEDLCNRGLWNVAEEYQQLIYKILVNFADTLGEKVNEYVPELSPVLQERNEISRILIRKLIYNIFSEAQYIDTMMELADRKSPDSAVALSQEEMREIVILLSQADYLKDYLKEHNIPYTDSNKCTKLNCPFQLGVIPDDCDEKECLWRTEEKTGKMSAKRGKHIK